MLNFTSIISSSLRPAYSPASIASQAMMRAHDQMWNIYLIQFINYFDNIMDNGNDPPALTPNLEFSDENR